ncbi:hypothetical protein HOY80DRAFT_1062950 [Tuber brumale]|nr:hypothetical protein HOY80DRAFT_1062950 [Tuber brumale]
MGHMLLSLLPLYLFLPPSLEQPRYVYFVSVICERPALMEIRLVSLAADSGRLILLCLVISGVILEKALHMSTAYDVLAIPMVHCLRPGTRRRA